MRSINDKNNDNNLIIQENW